MINAQTESVTLRHAQSEGVTLRHAKHGEESRHNWRDPSRLKGAQDDSVEAGYHYERSSMKQYYVYILTNRKGTLYIGMTNNINRRLLEHINKRNKGFTYKYNIDTLLYYEIFDRPMKAIRREKVLKGWTRERKIKLIKTKNPNLEKMILF